MRIPSILVAVCLLAATVSSQSGFVNFESSPVHPIQVSADGLHLYVLDTPNAALQVWSLQNPDQPVLLKSIPVGLEPVSLAVRNSNEIWVTESVSDSVSVVSISQGRVIDTIRVKDDPGDIVFAGTPERAFISVSGSDEIRVFDPTTRNQLAVIPILGKEPRALARNAAGDKVYALVFRSGNRTTLIPAGLAPPPPPPTRPGLPPGPPQSLIVDLDDPQWAFHPMNIPDNDLAEIDASSFNVTRLVKSIGTINYDLAFDATDDALWVVNIDSRNAIRFMPNFRAHYIDSRVVKLNMGSTQPTRRIIDLHADFDYETIPNATDRAHALAEPVAVVVDGAQGEIWIASQGSDRLGVLSREGNLLQRIELTSTPPDQRDTLNMRGPRGLALHPVQHRLYVFNRLSHSFSIVDTASRTLIGEWSLGRDPTPAIIRDGRKYLYDARLSGNGSGSCAACHVDGEHDLLSWDLGDPGGKLEKVPHQSKPDFLPPGSVPDWDFHPMRGPMGTQTLRGLAGNAPYHWRGEIPGLMDINGDFPALMGGDLLPEAEMSLLAGYMERIAHSPNPNQNLDRTYDASAARGEKTFRNTPAILWANGQINKCATCHSEPDGSSSRIFLPATSAFIGATQPMNTPQLRGLWRRGTTPALGQPTKVGFGFANDGMFPSLRAFLDLNTFNAMPTAEKDDLAHFLESFDSGTAPIVGYRVLLDASTASQSSTLEAIQLMESRAQAGDCDLVLVGTVDGLPRGLQFDPQANLYNGDEAGFGPFNRAAILSSAQTGHVVATFMAVPPGEGQRLGLDRDLDGQLNGEDGLERFGVPAATSQGPLLLDGNREPRLGDAGFAITTLAAPPGAQGMLVAALAPATSNVAGVPVYLDISAGPLLTAPFQADASGAAFDPRPIPSSPILAGYVVYVQAFFPDTSTPGGIVASNGLKITIQP